MGRGRFGYVIAVAFFSLWCLEGSTMQKLKLLERSVGSYQFLKVANSVAVFSWLWSLFHSGLMYIMWNSCSIFRIWYRFSISWNRLSVMPCGVYFILFFCSTHRWNEMTVVCLDPQQACLRHLSSCFHGLFRSCLNKFTADIAKRICQMLTASWCHPRKMMESFHLGSWN